MSLFPINTSGKEIRKVRISCLDCQTSAIVTVYPGRMKLFQRNKKTLSEEDTLRVCYMLRRHSGHRLYTEEIKNNSNNVWATDDDLESPPPWELIPTEKYVESDVTTLRNKIDDLQREIIDLKIDKESLILEKAMESKDSQAVQSVAKQLMESYASHSNMRNNNEVSNVKQERLAVWTMSMAENFGFDQSEMAAILESVGLGEHIPENVEAAKIQGSPKVKNHGIISLDQAKAIALSKMENETKE